MSFLKRFFGKKEEPLRTDFSEEESSTDHDLKTKGLETVLGKMHNTVGHAIIPFELGGAVDMYYFPNHIKGTGFATMELLNPDGKGPKHNRFGTYELVAFTKHDFDTGEGTDGAQTAFQLAERNACGFLTTIGSYASQAVLNPNETIEVPNGEEEETTCLVFDLYEPDGKRFKIGKRKHHLLLCLQVFRSEMEFARNKGSYKLFRLLKEKGFYPYSDLDREPVK